LYFNLEIGFMASKTIRRALLSVSDKTGLVELAQALVSRGVQILSTGGTARTLADNGIAVTDVSQVTGFPEILDGRVKTLHPNVHGGILARRDNAGHMQTIREHNIEPIDMVVVNLYPFEETVARGSDHETTVENIDIGGPSMVRSAAKNYADVAIVTSPDQYAGIVQELNAENGSLSLETRERLAAAAFALTARYDAAISAYFQKRAPETFPRSITLAFEKSLPLRYGENPHQGAAFYVEPRAVHPCIATAEQIHGKELSFNNILDLDSAFNLVKEFSASAAVVIKHNNPCGAAVGATQEEAFRKAYEGDPISAFGGILAFNQELDEATAFQITEPNRFIECIIAPGFSDKALHLLTTRPTWKKNVRLLRVKPLSGEKVEAMLDYRRVDGGLLVQARDVSRDDFGQARVVTNRQPSEVEMADLQFAWLVCKHVKSNAIIFAREGMVIGVGAGQMSRVDSVHLATRKGGDRVAGCVLASDAFFPFRDNVDAAAKVGITAIVQPGGSMRDQDSINACNEHGLAMVFTGMRHFRH
jgi:phosphoribosylaminoimidazolecarboxamide formyltransferase/IMP cyclohydrolase